jgi:hypothetical protein
MEVDLGREALCVCTWNGKKHQVKVLLEPPELIVRGEIARRIPFAKIEKIKAEDNDLLLSFEGDSVRLQLGSVVAAKWAEAMLKPPPTLAKKLGISADVTVQTIGPVDDPAFKAALKEAKSISQSKGDLILARVDTPADLAAALHKAARQLAAGIPIWFIYRKGPGHPLNENLVRTTALATGIVDTKIASVSAELSALRFIKRRNERPVP